MDRVLDLFDFRPGPFPPRQRLSRRPGVVVPLGRPFVVAPSQCLTDGEVKVEGSEGVLTERTDAIDFCKCLPLIPFTSSWIGSNV